MSFAKHIDAINTIMENTGNELTRLETEIQSKREELQQRKRAATTPARLAAVNEERDEVEAKYRAETAAVIERGKKAVESARKDLEKDTADFLAVHPENVDTAAVTLLNAGIVTDTDLVRLAVEQGQNVTMLKLFAKEAEKMVNDSRTARSLVAQIKAFIEPDTRLDVFNGALLNAHVGASPDFFQIARSAWSEHAYGQFKAEMQALDSFTFVE